MHLKVIHRLVNQLGQFRAEEGLGTPSSKGEPETGWDAVDIDLEPIIRPLVPL